MPASKLQRTVNSVNEHLLSLAQATCARDLAIGTNWNSVRIGLRCGFYAPNGNADFGTEGNADDDLYIGLTTDPAKHRGDSANLDHYIGARILGTWVHSGTNLAYFATHSFDEEWQPEKFENGTRTQGTLLSGQWAVGAIPDKFLALYVDIIKGSPWTVEVRSHAGSNVPITHDQFKSNMIAADPGSRQSSGGLSIDEATYGNLTVPTVRWANNETHWFEIADFEVSIMT